MLTAVMDHYQSLFGETTFKGCITVFNVLPLLFDGKCGAKQFVTNPK